MSDKDPTRRAPRRLLERAIFAVAITGPLLAVITVIAVYRIMTDFHDELVWRPGAVHDPMLLDAIASESSAMILMLATIVLVAAFNIAAGFLTLRKSWR